MSTEQTKTKSIGESLFPKTKRDLLTLFFLNPGKSFYLREIVKFLGTSPGAVTRELNNLVNAEILLSELHKNRRYFKVNVECCIFSELKDIIVKTFGVVDILKNALEPMRDKIEAAFIYGSFAQKTDKGTSDIDVMIISDMPFREFSKLLAPAEKKLQRDINFTIYPTTTLLDKKFKDNHFLSSVFETNVIPIYISQNSMSTIKDIIPKLNLNQSL